MTNYMKREQWLRAGSSSPASSNGGQRGASARSAPSPGIDPDSKRRRPRRHAWRDGLADQTVIQSLEHVRSYRAFERALSRALNERHYLGRMTLPRPLTQPQKTRKPAPRQRRKELAYRIFPASTARAAGRLRMRCGETLGGGSGFRPRPDDSGSWSLASRSGFRSIQKIAPIHTRSGFIQGNPG
jgi:hypothetical protein